MLQYFVFPFQGQAGKACPTGGRCCVSAAQAYCQPYISHWVCDLFHRICRYNRAKLIEFLADGKAFRAWVEQQGILGPLTLVGIMVLQVVIAIIPGEAVEIGAGYAFAQSPACFSVW